ncbi:MAG: hypothetical protein JWQ88_2139, partial [Rhodoferax sp.]|nr:hypothetical protein [Rhodoferax sp.]
KAYRAGGERVADLLGQGWSTAFGQPGDTVSTEMRRNAQLAQAVAGSMVHLGLDLSARSATVVVDKLVELAQQGVAQASANAARFDEHTGVPALDKLATVAAPAAVAVQRLASQVEAKSGAWAAKVAGDGKAARKPASAFAKARARRTA